MQFMFQINILLNLQLFKNISHIYIRKHAIYVPNEHFNKFTIIQKHFSHIYANMRFMFQKHFSHIYTQTCDLCSK